MGAFFLFRSGCGVDVDSAKGVFIEKGLSQPEMFRLGEWHLLLYRKILLDIDNYLVDEMDHSVFCCGTVAYRGLGYRESLNRLLVEFRGGRIETSAVQGNYCLLFWDGRFITLMTDPLNAQHVFVNESGTCLSSSFLSLLASSPSRLALNRLAIAEKLVTGCIVGPDTLVDGIQQVDSPLLESLPQSCGIRTITHNPWVLDREFHRNGLRDSLSQQITSLQRYFRGIRALHEEHSGELGLSSGFDSRLILAFSREFARPIPLHTHSTSHVHDAEIAAVRRLAEVSGNPLTIVPTRRMEDIDEESFGAVIRDNLFFFDGRCCNDMGSYSETYTLEYRRRVLGSNRLSFVGLGGEIFRNVYATPQRRFRWSAWFNSMILFPFAEEVLTGSMELAEVRSAVNRKIARRIGFDVPAQADLFLTRAYYAAVRMPDCASNVLNAYGQVGFVIAPFIERPIVQEALRANPYIGHGGAYQAAMIRDVSPELAAIGSHYGFTFSKIPRVYLAKDWVRSVVPLALRRRRARWLAMDDRRNPDYVRYHQRLATSPALREIHVILADVFPSANWSVAVRHYAQKWIAISVGSFLKEFQSKLKWGN